MSKRFARAGVAGVLVVGTLATASILTSGASGKKAEPSSPPLQATEVLAVLRSEPAVSVPEGNGLAQLAEPVQGREPTDRVVPDLDAARHVVVSQRDFWITPSVDGRQACIGSGYSAEGTGGATCAPTLNLGPGQAGIFEVTRPAPNVKAAVDIIGIVADGVAGVRLHFSEGKQSYSSAVNNVIYVQADDVPESLEAVRPGAEANSSLPLNAGGER